MKNTNVSVAVIIIILLGGLGFYYFNKGRTAENNISQSTPTETSPIEGCYVAKLAKDVYTLTILSQADESFDARLSFKNFEKDSSSGTYKGTYKNGILLGDYSFDSEGMHSVMQVIFKKTANGFVRGYGDVDANGTHFTDLNNIRYDNSPMFNEQACGATI